VPWSDPQFWVVSVVALGAVLAIRSALRPQGTGGCGSGCVPRGAGRGGPRSNPRRTLLTIGGRPATGVKKHRGPGR